MQARSFALDTRLRQAARIPALRAGPDAGIARPGEVVLLRNSRKNLGQRGLRKIPTDSEFRMDVRALEAGIDEDKRNGIVRNLTIKPGQSVANSVK